MGSEGPGRPSPVSLDANLLYPFHLRNLLVQLSVDSIITPRWTGRIHEEWIGNLVAAGKAPRDRLPVTLALMNDVLPEADLRGWEAYMGGWRCLIARPDRLQSRDNVPGFHLGYRQVAQVREHAGAETLVPLIDVLVVRPTRLMGGDVLLRHRPEGNPGHDLAQYLRPRLGLLRLALVKGVDPVPYLLEQRAGL